MNTERRRSFCIVSQYGTRRWRPVRDHVQVQRERCGQQPIEEPGPTRVDVRHIGEMFEVQGGGTSASLFSLCLSSGSLEIGLSNYTKITLKLNFLIKIKKINFGQKKLQVRSTGPILGVRSSVLLEEEPQAREIAGVWSNWQDARLLPGKVLVRTQPPQPLSATPELQRKS